VLESAGGATLGASLAAARRVTGQVVVYGMAGGEAPITKWELVYKHQVHVIGLNIGVLIQAAQQIFGEVMGELSALIAAGVLTPGQPTAYELADGPKALAEPETRATVGKLAPGSLHRPGHPGGGVPVGSTTRPAAGHAEIYRQGSSMPVEASYCTSRSVGQKVSMSESGLPAP
jgi:hypothetical protein